MAPTSAPLLAPHRKPRWTPTDQQKGILETVFGADVRAAARAPPQAAVDAHRPAEGDPRDRLRRRLLPVVRAEEAARRAARDRAAPGADLVPEPAVARAPQGLRRRAAAAAR